MDQVRLGLGVLVLVLRAAVANSRKAEACNDRLSLDLGRTLGGKSDCIVR
jgi:hypothetical protein